MQVPSGCHPMLSSPEFDRQIRLFLENMYDFSYLQGLPLAQALCASDRTVDQSIRVLRQEILGAIEALNPPESMPPRAKERRPYLLLYGRYVQGMTTSELVEELAISVRQLRREQKRALAAIASLMSSRLANLLSADVQDGSSNAPRQGTAALEAERLMEQAQTEELSVPQVLSGVLSVLAPVAINRGIMVRNQLSDSMAPVRADRIALRQAVLGLISYAMDQVNAEQIMIEHPAGSPVGLQITAVGEPSARISSSSPRLDVSKHLIAGIEGRLTLEDAPGRWQATIEFPAAQATPVLVMDDNQGMVELFKRYLAGGRYQVTHAVTTEEILQHARESSPRLIILDIMMPREDGWEVLQKLRAAPETKDVPILVCSALNERDIARGLGASDYLTKPVTQDALLEKVERWCRSGP